MGVLFGQLSARFAHFTVAIIVLPKGLFVVWWINLSPLVQSAENIAAVRESVQENPKQSILRRSQELGFSKTTTWRILRRGLGLHPYKIQLTQELKIQ
ncbi:hypothetical protein NQ318_005495 [Aromia moschata]|uniref:Uncharacterized protein n=1 Tax=Aromia moschata TaxID=1265417 RepID=A0AAV8XPC2_9CUCU|nr:hypothetical protein NQ318_005495 [Aromia moschata]